MTSKTGILLITMMLGFQPIAQAQELVNKIKKSVRNIGDTFSDIPEKRLAVLLPFIETIPQEMLYVAHSINQLAHTNK